MSLSVLINYEEMTNESSRLVLFFSSQSLVTLLIDSTCRMETENANILRVKQLKTFLIAPSIKSNAISCPAFWANSPVNRPIPAPSSNTVFPSYGGSRESTYMTIQKFQISGRQVNCLTCNHANSQNKPIRPSSSASKLRTKKYQFLLKAENRFNELKEVGPPKRRGCSTSV